MMVEDCLVEVVEPVVVDWDSHQRKNHLEAVQNYLVEVVVVDWDSYREENHRMQVEDYLSMWESGLMLIAKPNLGLAVKMENQVVMEVQAWHFC